MTAASTHARPLPGVILHLVAVGAIGVLLVLVYGPGFVGIDAMWSLVWGRDLVHLAALSTSGTTTPHVLSNLLGAALTPFGADADRALVVVEYLAAGSLIWATGLTAREIAGTPAGVVAALLLLSREQLLHATRSGFLDVFAAAFVAWAVLLLVRWRGDRLRGVAVLLALAGLLRPEPWVLLAVVALVQWRRRGADPLVVALAVAVPLLWAVSDLVLSGDALFSLHETRRVSALVRIGQDIPTGWRERIVAVPRNLAHAPGPELLLLGGALALLFVWPGGRGARWRAAAFRERLAPLALEQLRLVVGVAAVLAGVVVLQGLTGTLLFARFLLPFAALLCVVAGVGLAQLAEAHLGSRAGLGLAAATALLLVIAAPFLYTARSDTSQERARYEAARRALRPGVPCGPVVVPGVNFRAYAAVWTGERGDAVVAAAQQLPPQGSYVDATGREPERLLLDPSFPQRRIADSGLARIRDVNGWVVRSRCPR